MNKNQKMIKPEQLLRIVLDAIPIRVFWKDRESTFLGGNQLFTQDLGLNSVEELSGKSDRDFFKDESIIEHFRNDDLEVILNNRSKLNIEEQLSVEGQSDKWLKTNKVPMVNDDGEVIGLLATYEDISEQVQYRTLIESQALIDPLTGIANRRKLQQTIAKHECRVAGLIFIDLDHFKIVNDTLGHAIGDALLVEVARRIASIDSNENTLVARLGGDEFSIYIPREDATSLQEYLQTLAQDILHCLTQPFTVKEHLINLGASIGITIISDGKNADNASFREADIAMYSAKEKGRNNFQFYNEGMKEKTQRKLKIKQCLAAAVQNNELHLVYQPQINSDNAIVGAEALLRWHSKELGFVAPDEFIPLAEESGLIHSIGTWVLETALDALLNWQSIIASTPEFKIAVNFSSKQFQNQALPKLVQTALTKRGVSPLNLQIEITESLLIDRRDVAVQSMIEMQQSGISIAIDDFGTGYSSLSYLATLPIDKLKIDRSFVSNLDKQPTNRKLVDTLISLSKNLDMDVIAEGVETEAEKRVLSELGCRQFQGYLYSKPIKDDEFLQLYSGR